jgi:hypothetical protein
MDFAIDDSELLVITMFCNHRVLPWVTCPVQHHRRVHVAYVELGLSRHLLHTKSKKNLLDEEIASTYRLNNETLNASICIYNVFVFLLCGAYTTVILTAN